MNTPSPAIVAQAAVRRFPRIVLLVFCLAYVLAGYIGREAWKNADMQALGFMTELARNHTSWLHPTVLDSAPEFPALLPYWLGAWAIQAAPAWVAFDFAARIPFGLLLALAMVSVWYGTYYLAKSPFAQPVSFAFGGEAQPVDYARTVADGGLLALMACLGLAHLSHETTPAVAQLGFSALLFMSVCALPYHRIQSLFSAMFGAIGLTLSGAPAISFLLCITAALIHVRDHSTTPTTNSHHDASNASEAGFLALLGIACIALGHWLDMNTWAFDLPGTDWKEWKGFFELLVWFLWPAWPLFLWSLWSWRDRLLSTTINRHLVLPLTFTIIPLGSALVSPQPDRTLLLALPPLAAIASFALPTLKRQVSAFVDWFTLFFFSGCGLIIWVIWIAMETGVPPQPAANVARLAPEFRHEFSWFAVLIAIAATLVWAWLVKWRAGRHRAALWKSLVLPAGGAGLCWLLLMTLWMPLLNHAQSYTSITQKLQAIANEKDCIAVQKIPLGTKAALVVYGNFTLEPYSSSSQCSWLLVEPDGKNRLPKETDLKKWEAHTLVQHAVGSNENLWLLKRR